MLKHVLAQERVRVNKQEFIKCTQGRREQMQAQPDGDLTLEQAIGSIVEWDLVADMAVRQGTSHLAKRVLAAAS